MVDHTSDWGMDLEAMRTVLEEVEQLASTDGADRRSSRAHDLQPSRTRKPGRGEDVGVREIAGHVPAFRLVTIKCEEIQVTSEYQEESDMKRIVDFYYGAL